MSDDGFFREVDEELRSDRVKQFWDRFGSVIITVALLVVVGTAAWRAWQWYERSEAASAGDILLQAERLEETRAEEAQALLRGLVEDGPGAYPNLARMKLAGSLATSNPQEAIALFDTVAEDSGADPEQRAIARLRAGLLLVDHGSVADVEARLLPLAGPTNAYRSSAREGLGLAYWKAGEAQKAFDQFSAVADDPNAPRNLAQRVGVMLDLIAGAGGPKREAPAMDEATPSAEASSEEQPAESN